MESNGFYVFYGFRKQFVTMLVPFQWILLTSTKFTCTCVSMHAIPLHTHTHKTAGVYVGVRACLFRGRSSDALQTNELASRAAQHNNQQKVLLP